MTDKKMSSKTSKLKNFLVTGSVEEKEKEGAVVEKAPPEETAVSIKLPEHECAKPPEQEEPLKEEVIIEDIIAEEMVLNIPAAECEPPNEPAPAEETDRLEKEMAEIKEMVAGLASELGKYATSKEQLKEYSSIVNRRDSELANKKLTVMLEQLSAMREDFFKLCKAINSKLDSFSAKDVLSSFEAYGVDMENILVDCGVQIGQSKFEKLNTTHQRIVDVIPTDDESMNGMIAERVSDGYVYQGRVLLKEKVKIYRFSENERTDGDEKE
ncbi:MAG: nucleotide exchange factor GrpE [Candidatus Methanoplasma sp.]|nr:nucleotide exchange factor GrpE [Candidatus Methanoplasma sp.]